MPPRLAHGGCRAFEEAPEASRTSADSVAQAGLLGRPVRVRPRARSCGRDSTPRFVANMPNGQAAGPKTPSRPSRKSTRAAA
ncbi:hypothetical protein B5F40_09075 [Gordonibacter sp. An230]|nr:hypothetical protein B5F40_09075 [Gordonibacter sp. An230]